MSNKSGLKRVGHSDTQAGAVTWIDSKIDNEATEITPDNTKTESTVGSVYGGSVLSFTVGLFDDTDYATYETMMTDDVEKFWHFEYQDGRVLTTKEAMNIFVRPATGTNARDGAAAWMMDNAERYGASPLL